VLVHLALSGTREDARQVRLLSSSPQPARS